MVYAHRRDVLLAALAEVPELEVVPSAAGLRVAAWFRDQDLDDVAVATAAGAVDVAVESLSVRFVSQPPRRGLAFGVGRIDAARIPEAIARLTLVLRDR